MGLGMLFLMQTLRASRSMMKKSKLTSQNISKIKTEPAPSVKVFDFSDVPENNKPTQGEDDAPLNANKYEDRYVAFVDILGFKELIAASAREKPDIEPSMTSTIFNALNISHVSLKDNFFSLISLPSPADTELDFQVHSFSDCVVASCHKTPYGLGLLLFFCWQTSSDWLSKSFLSRGGLACGKLLHKTNLGGAALIFGPAFNEAYKIESEIADLPRLIFSKEVRHSYQEIQDDLNPTSGKLKEVTKALVTRFPDGPMGIDIFAHLRNGGLDSSSQSHGVDAGQYKNALTSHLHDASDTPQFFRKIQWLVGRFNEAILRSKYADNHIEPI